MVSKKQKLKELEKKEKALNKSLPKDSLETKIAKLEKEIAELERKTKRTAKEETLLKEKKQELEKLQKELAEKNQQNNSSQEKDKSDKTPLCIGLGIVGVVLVGLLVVLFRRGKKNSKKQ